MRRSMFVAVLSVLSCCGIQGKGSAAELAPVYKAAPALKTWTGFYVGAHIGYGWGRLTGPDLSIDERGGIGGVQMGLNHQFAERWLIGLEQDLSFAAINGSSPLCCGTTGTIDGKIRALASFRGRIGVVWDRLLVYQTGGVALANVRPQIVVVAPAPENLTDNRWMAGVTAGAGIEFAASSNVTVKAEYLYFDFPNKNFFSGTDQNGAADFHAHTVRIGVNYLLR